MISEGLAMRRASKIYKGTLYSIFYRVIVTTIYANKTKCLTHIRVTKN